MTKLTKLPVTIVTGFLGSGKTTLIRHLMQYHGGKRLAVIVNEFGDVGIDGDILKSCAFPSCPQENIIELANGCICCRVADDFIPTIETLLKINPLPDHILIETSGLALPKPLLKAFDWPEIRSKITVDGVITLADSEAIANGRFVSNIFAVEAQRQENNSVDHETPLSEVFEDQIKCADIVLLTKTDLVTPYDIETARNTIIKKIKRNLPIIEVQEGIIDPRVILGLESAAEDDLAARPSHHDQEHNHDHDDFESFVISLDAVESPESVSFKMEQIAREQNILRAKGYVAVKNKPMRLLVQAVGARVRSQYDRAWKPNERRESRIVFIAEHNDIEFSAIEAVMRG